MELKVWVDGVQRVVCGVSEQTTCQEVVIALAQALGQTGRYVLIQRLRDKERQMLPQECPLGAQATCGQFASDVQFVLRRTGPSLAERPPSDPCLPPRPRPPPPHHPPVGSPCPEGCPVGVGGELWGLELLIQSNEAELGQEGFWEEELQRELAHELAQQGHRQQLQAATEECARHLRELDAQARALEEEISWCRRRRQQQQQVPSPGRPQDELAAARLHQDLQAQALQSQRLESSLASVGRALAEAEQSLQAQAQEVLELNKELRQCNLQQFIQQAGTALPPRLQGSDPSPVSPGLQQVREPPAALCSLQGPPTSPTSSSHALPRCPA
ncbi:ras association domain-containing protein 7 isoform X2 [Monodelphis domestica]|uniref:ras association domain-containing protein 7 isoform X2 n=1 Tax=Monodelphis domestica TaxID=13616 RepID=UPI0024E2355C|nr:ras association domain-containing protein 7 isoform X2 [Monodelphis domestica]XP_007506488.2 ras association domain-containing protein 7 isoform X2 [Monodelphis domestica]XP_056657053.1 ras association domain-containing protein 7 isoform X2 [Monodelphis domestica]